MKKNSVPTPKIITYLRTGRDDSIIRQKKKIIDYAQNNKLAIDEFQKIEGVSEKGLNEQIKTMKAYCASQGWENVIVNCDDEVSDKNKKVPSFHHMTEDIVKGRINAIIVMKLDCLSRSMLTFKKIFKTLERQKLA